jgi:hypothetical protein
MIEGHEAVEAYFKREQALVDAHGSTITFQLFRINLKATTLAELQGEKLTEIRVDGSWVSGHDTVAMVKDRVRSLLNDHATAADRITFYFNHQPMKDDALFYVDHFMILPVWVQVLLHDGEAEDIEEALHRLQQAGAP